MTQIPGEEVAAAAAVAAATGAAAAAAATAVAAVPTRRQRPSPVYSAMARARTAMIREVSAVRRHPAICSSTYCSGPGALRIDVTCPEMDVGGTASSPHTNRASVHATGSGEGSSGNWGWGTTGQSDTAPAIRGRDGPWSSPAGRLQLRRLLVVAVGTLASSQPLLANRRPDTLVLLQQL